MFQDGFDAGEQFVLHRFDMTHLSSEESHKPDPME